jgi:hypothetical protein
MVHTSIRCYFCVLQMFFTLRNLAYSYENQFANKNFLNVWFCCLDIIEGEGHGHDSGHSHLAQVEPVLHLQPSKRVPPNLRVMAHAQSTKLQYTPEKILRGA